MALGTIGGGIIGGAGITIVIRAVDKFSRVFKTANIQLSGFMSTIQKNRALIAGAGIALTAMGIAGIAAMSGMVKEAISFESAFIGVRKTVELTELEFKELENRFKSLSNEIPITFQELSSICEIAGQLGVTGVNYLEKFTKTIADISATTNLTAEVAATDFARLANVMQEPLKNIDKMGSVVVELGNNFATTEGEILSFATRIAGVSNIVGLTTADTLALGAAFSAVGVQAEAGGTAVQKILLKMNESVFLGGKKLEAFAITAGITSEEFQKVFQEDASKAFELFVLGLGEQGDAAINTLDALELTDVRLTRSLLSLANAGDLVTRTFKSSDEEWKKNNALTEEANKRYKSMESQIKILSNKFKILSADLGKELFPILEDIIDVVGFLVSGFSNLSSGTKKLIIIVGLGVTVFGLIVGPILIIISLLPSLIGGLTLLSGAFTSTSITAGIATTSIAGTTVAVGGLTIAITALLTVLGAFAIVGILIGITAFQLKKLNEQINEANKLVEEGTHIQAANSKVGVEGLINITDRQKQMNEMLITTNSSTTELGRNMSLTLQKNSTDWIDMKDIATMSIDEIIDKLNQIPTEYTTIHNIITQQKGGGAIGGAKITTIFGTTFNPKAFSRSEFKSPADFTQAKRFAGFDDFIVRPGQEPMSFNPDDTIIGLKDISNLGGTSITINIENIQGLDPDEIAEALQDKLNNIIST